METPEGGNWALFIVIIIVVVIIIITANVYGVLGSVHYFIQSSY
jgi:hypothetical protein